MFDHEFIGSLIENGAGGSQYELFLMPPQCDCVQMFVCKVERTTNDVKETNISAYPVNRATAHLRRAVAGGEDARGIVVA